MQQGKNLDLSQRFLVGLLRKGNAAEVPFTNAGNMRNKQEELEIVVQFEKYCVIMEHSGMTHITGIEYND